MDYEKAYKEALGWMRKIYPTLTGATKEDAEHYFSELKESEDEKIRQALIRFFKHTHNWANLKYDGDEIVAYLERQKELAVIPDELVKNYKLFCEQGGRELALLINAINGFNKQKGQQPAEWSEEDRRHLDRIQMVLESWDRSHTSIAGLPSTIPDDIDWLIKSLRPQPRWKPSEEQMRCLWDCVSKAKEIHNASVGGYDAYRILMSLFNDIENLL